MKRATLYKPISIHSIGPALLKSVLKLSKPIGFPQMELGNCSWRRWPDAWFTRISFTRITLGKTTASCYRNRSHFFTVQQGRATTQAGCVSGVVPKAQGDAFF